jgi:hypothetical protein
MKSHKMLFTFMAGLMVLAICTSLAFALYDNVSKKTTPTVANPDKAASSLTYSDNGKTITIAKGQTLTVSLDSTYWRFGESSNPAVLAQAGEVIYQPAAHSYAGSGAGVATAQFIATTTGMSTITASRTSCGEARGCPDGQGSFSITVSVK